MKKKLLVVWCILGLFNVKVAAAAPGLLVDLGEIVVSSSRMAQLNYKLASNISVITREEIEASNGKTVSDILQQELGVNIYDNSTPKTAIIDIRGFGDTASRNVLVLVNDRKVNSIDISGPDTMQIPLGEVERIEIIRGAGSVLYGDNAVGGVVNIITKKGKGKLKGSVETKHGSYATSIQQAEVSGSKSFQWLGLPQDVSYLFYSSYSDTDGYRTNSNVLAKDYNTRLGYEMSDKLGIDLNFGWHEDDYGLPGGLTAAEIRSLGRRGSTAPKDFANTKDRYVQLVLDVKPWPEDFDLGNLVLDFSYRNRDTYASFQEFGLFDTKRMIDSYSLNSKYIFNKELFNREFRFVTGMDFYDTDNDILGSQGNTDDLTISKREWGLYANTEYEVLNNLYANLGTRWQTAEYTFDQRQTTRGYNTNTPKESVNSFGMKYEYGKGSNVFMNVQQTFRFLATDEWYDSFSGTLNLDLKQQTGIQYEVGVKHNIKDIHELTVTPYWMDLRNEIFFNPSSGFFGSNDNYPKTRRRGIEVGTRTDLKKTIWDVEFLDKWELATNYSFQDPRFIDGANNDKLIPFAPEHQASFGFNFDFLKHYSLSLGGRYVGSHYAINDTLNVTPREKAYYVMDSKLSFHHNNLEVFAAWNNMFNKMYNSYTVKSTSSTTKDYYPAAGTNFLIGTKLQF